MAREPQSLEEAIEYYSKANDEMQLARISFYEKIALYSGAIISLSVTFVGYLLSGDPSVFLYLEMQIPLYVFIFSAWACLAWSLFVGIYIRLFYANHLSRMMHAEWVRLHTETREDILHQIETGKAHWNNLEGEAITEANNRAKETLYTYQTIKKDSERMVAIYNLVGPFLRGSIVVLFVVGCMLTLVFVGFSVLNLANQTPQSLVENVST